MKIFSAILLLSLSSAALADCAKDYKAYKRQVYYRPLTSLSTSTAYGAAGTILSSSGVAGGTITSDTELSTMGMVYGAAMIYEGVHNVDLAYTHIKRYNSRGNASKIIKEAELGFGEKIEGLTDDINEELDAAYSTDEIAELIRWGNEERIFCSAEFDLYGVEEMKLFLLESISLNP